PEPIPEPEPEVIEPEPIPEPVVRRPEPIPEPEIAEEPEPEPILEPELFEAPESLRSPEVFEPEPEEPAIAAVPSKPVPKNPPAAPITSPSVPNPVVTRPAPAPAPSPPSRPAATPAAPASPSSAVASAPSAPANPTQSGDASLLGSPQGQSLSASPERFFQEEDLGARLLAARRNADLGPYYRNIQRRVRQAWQPSQTGQERFTVLVFSLTRDGEIARLRVLETSGSSRVDREALAAVRQAAPFGPFPESYSEPSLDIEFSFSIFIRSNGRF
ncbi:MAG: TonB family protein, partial [Cyanobacteria bacterium J06641_5]